MHSRLWGEQHLTLPKVGGRGGLIGGYCVSPGKHGSLFANPQSLVSSPDFQARSNL